MQITETLQFFAEHFGEASAIVWNMAMFLTVVAGLILGLLTGSFLHRNHMAEMDEDTMLVIRRREMWREEHRKELEEEMLREKRKAMMVTEEDATPLHPTPTPAEPEQPETPHGERPLEKHISSVASSISSSVKEWAREKKDEMEEEREEKKNERFSRKYNPDLAQVKTVEQRIAERPTTSWMAMNAAVLDTEYTEKLEEKRSGEDHSYEVMKRRLAKDAAES